MLTLPVVFLCSCAGAGDFEFDLCAAMSCMSAVFVGTGVVFVGGWALDYPTCLFFPRAVAGRQARIPPVSSRYRDNHNLGFLFLSWIAEACCMSGTRLLQGCRRNTSNRCGLFVTP